MPCPPCSVTLPPGAARAGQHSSGKREGGEGEAPGSGHSAISTAFYWAQQLVEPVQCRAGEQGCVCREELQLQCRWHGDRAASTGAVGATNPHAHRGQVSWAVSWAPTPGSWSCLFKEPLDIQLLSVPFGPPAYFLPSSGRCFQLFPPSSDLRGVSGRSDRSLQGRYLWGQQWEGGLPFPDNLLVLISILKIVLFIISGCTGPSLLCGLFSGCGVKASPRRGFSCRGAQAPRRWRVRSSRIRGAPRSPALAGRVCIPEPPGKPTLALFTHDHVCLNLEMVRH